MLIVNKAEWHDTADVVVIGYGGAGAVAAVTAHDQGADVLILDKQPVETHITNTSMSGGVFITSTDVKRLEEYLRALAHVDKDMSWTDQETIKVWAEYTCQNKEWVEKQGGKLKQLPTGGGSHREIPDNDVIKHHYFEERGAGFMGFLKSLVSQRKIKVTHGVRAKRLLTNHRNEVIGVTAERESGAEINFKAVRAVILATGGFEYNEAMKLQFLRCYPVHFTGSPANTGDGVKMAMAVGADLWHMNCCSSGFVIKFPELPIALSPLIRRGDFDLGRLPSGEWGVTAQCGYVIVDKRGHRFINENYKTHHATYELAAYDSKGLNFPRIPSYWIMDHRRITSGPIAASGSHATGAVNRYKWSAGNSEEIEAGWIIRADTVAELGRKLGIDVEELKRTVEDYNGYCRNNKDSEFRRRPESLVPLDAPPYYAVKLWPGGPNTQGGPRRNYRSQVMNTEGDPISGLYAAGELGSVFGMLYTGAGNLAECISFGRIAGERAAKEKPRSID